MLSIIEKYGQQVYVEAIDELLDRSERTAREAIAAIPDGTYTLEDFMDDNGVDTCPIKLRCEVTVMDSDVTIDLSGSANEQGGPFNCPWGYTLTTCRFAIKRITTPDLPPNSGEARPLTVIAPERSIFNPAPPSPVFCGAWTSLRLGDMIVQALAPALMERVPAENGGDTMVALAYLKDPVTRRLSFFFDLGGPGHGAMHGKDGMSALIHPVQAGSESMPAEILETRMPVMKKRFELMQDSGGPGAFRGGLAAAAEFEFRSDGEAVVIAEKTKASEVCGLAGGMSPPLKNAIVVYPDTDKEIRLGKRANLSIQPGDRLIVQPAGGGGYGDPLERDSERVAWDVLNEYVSRSQAERAYGVAIDDETGQVHQRATNELRRRLRAERASSPGAHSPAATSTRRRK